MAWYYNESSGELTRQSGAIADLTGWLNTHAHIGWHKLHVPDSATEAQAAADAVKEFPHGKPPTTSTTTAIKQQISSETGLKNPLSWTQAVGRFFAHLSDWHIWASLGWIALGIVLMLLGLRLWIGKLTPAGTPGPVGLL